MGKTFLSSIILAIAMLLTGCSNDPFVGEWAPDNDTSGASVTRINSDGTMKFYGDVADGYYSIKGKWSRVEDNDNSITVNYDPATIQIDLVNPIESEIIKMGLTEMASHTLSFTLSEDGEKLYGGGNGYFIRY